MDPSHFTYSTSTDHDIRDDNGNVIGSASVSITAKVPSGEDQAAKASEVLRRVAGMLNTGDGDDLPPPSPQDSDEEVSPWTALVQTASSFATMGAWTVQKSSKAARPAKSTEQQEHDTDVASLCILIVILTIWFTGGREMLRDLVARR